MFKMNEPVLVDSPSEALKNESGVFELVSPQGEVLLLACEPGLAMGVPERVSFDPRRTRTDNRWEIKKIAESPPASA